METDFINFTKLYGLIILMFTLIGQINFGFDLKDYKNLWLAFIKVLKTSIGGYEFDKYKDFADNDKYQTKLILSDLFTFAVVSSCRILLLNIVIAFLTNSYMRYKMNSKGIYLTKIIGSRSSQASDPHYGCYLANLTPADFVLIPFIPYAMLRKPSVELNNALVKIQYFILLFIYYVIFAIGSVVLTPFAFLKALSSKLYIMSSKSSTNKELLCNSFEVISYLIFGPVICVLNFLTDSIYFWIFNLTDKLATNEVIR